jgi:phage tail-like protein
MNATERSLQRAKQMAAMSAASALGVRQEIHNDFRFNVIVDDIYLFTFTEFTLPSLSVEIDTWKEGGQNTFSHKLAKRVELGTIKLKHAITTEMSLLGWYMDVMNGDMESAKRQVDVELIAPMGYAAIVWNFRDAFPIKWTGPLLKSDATGITIDEIEMVYHSFDITTGSALDATQNLARMASFNARQQFGL